MLYPSGITEEVFLAACSGAMRQFGRKHTFGYFDLDDIFQEIRIFAMECLPRYDCIRPLESFIADHTRRRWINLKRNKYHRADPPCKTCHNGVPCENAVGFSMGSMCERYRRWADRNGRKANLTRPQPFDEWDHSREAYTQAEVKEIEVMIDEYLPVELRRDYLKMREDCFVPRPRKRAVQEYCKLILSSGVYKDEYKDIGGDDDE